jgi:hypothetical protein
MFKYTEQGKNIERWKREAHNCKAIRITAISQQKFLKAREI